MAQLVRQAREEAKDDPDAAPRLAYLTWTFGAFVEEAKEQWAAAGKP